MIPLIIKHWLHRNHRSTSNRHHIKIWIDMLTFLAGFLNGGFFLIASAAVSHHTGNLTRLALIIAKGSFAEALAIIVLPVFFYGGACIAGLLFHNKNFTLSKRYGIVLVCFSLFFLLIALIKPTMQLILIITSGILGIQNGMFIFYRGMLIRTSHISGYLTDAGFALGMALRGNRKEFQHSLFHLSRIICFFIGAILSSFTHTNIFFGIASCLYFLAGIFYFVFVW